MKRNKQHLQVIKDFLAVLNKESEEYVLKGGTALMLCYDLDRFSEDIDLDGLTDGIEEKVGGFCKSRGYVYRVAKDIPFVKRYFINYGREGNPLKIKVSYMNKWIDERTVTKIGGIRVYTIDALCQQKSHAYEHRDKIRDLYDLSFICGEYFEDLTPSTVVG